MTITLRDRSIPDVHEAGGVVLAAACFSAGNVPVCMAALGFTALSYLVRRANFWIDFVMQGERSDDYNRLPTYKKLLLPGPIRKDLKEHGLSAVSDAFFASQDESEEREENLWDVFQTASSGNKVANSGKASSKGNVVEGVVVHKDWQEDDWTSVKQLPAPSAATSLATELQRLPKPGYALRALGKAPESRYAVPIGIGANGALWLDFERDILHMGLYGTSGGGKDTHLRVAFFTLTRRCRPEDVQFFYLDGKGDWLLPMLKGRAFMWRDPAGGTGEAGRRSLKAGVEAVQAEMTRRLALVQSANCRTREAYIKKTGDNLPLLIVVFSDVMDAIGAEIETLLIDLVSKARAVGIRVVVSMQTPTGASMKWRSNLSTNISASIPDRTQDAPALGLSDKAMRYRPSELPSPKQRPGVLIVRHGDEQHLVQGTYIDEDFFDEWVESLALRATHSETPDFDHDRVARSVATHGVARSDTSSDMSSEISSDDDFDLLGGLIDLNDQQVDDIVRTLRRQRKSDGKPIFSQDAIRDELKKAGLSISQARLASLTKEIDASL